MKKKHQQKFIFLAFLGAILHHISIAQVGNRYSYELFPLFQKSTTLIVLDDKETSYNRMMRKIIAEQWIPSCISRSRVALYTQCDFLQGLAENSRPSSF